MPDWLFGIPGENLSEQEKIAAEWLAADPAAAAITDEEAQAFFAAAVVVRCIGRSGAAEIWRRARVRVSHYGPKARRRATVMVLRRWKDFRFRAYLTELTMQCSFQAFPDPYSQAERWTDELFATAYAARVPLMWLVYVRRYLGKTEGLEAWLQTLAVTAPRYYRLWLNAGRLTLRRIVYPAMEPGRAAEQVAAAAQTELVTELHAKDRQSGVLRQDVRRLERGRRHLKQRARRAEQAARAVLTQARGEVDAARRGLEAQRLRQAQELAEHARQCAGELAALRARLAGAREEFVRTLSAVICHGPAELLRGRTVTVDGADGDREIHRLLVESLGGSLGSGVAIGANVGFAAFDRQLRRLALSRVLVKCDGLYRRKERRAGIAISGFQVHIGDAAPFRDSSVVCCGPAAGSLMAEYGAVAMALGWLLAGDPPPGAKLEIWSDCKTMLSRIRQPQPGRRQLGCILLDRTVRRLIRSLLKRGCDVQLRWVPRDQVDAVDRLCDTAYRAQLWYHKPARRPNAPLKAFLGRLPGFVPWREGTATAQAAPALPTGAIAARAPSRQRQGQP